MLSQLGILFVQWFLLLLFTIEVGSKLYLNWDHQFGIVEDPSLYDEISQDQRGTALAVASLVFAGLAIILSDSPGQYVLQIEIFVAAFGMLLIAAFAHELTLTYRIVLTLQEMTLEYGLMLMVWGIFLLIYELSPETGPVLALVSLAVFLFRFASLKGELEAHANE
ncbi:hypothetical protein NP511_18050 [Natrinema thermotolerans]|uniref:Uncharacterized protein n=1 Tax=Natrinema thermotolerans TaxID=121872 RepID=A0AAF0T5E1_9EURY|nr:hypothetical protein [Natrinema thermotolerans]QCC60259.1 hypothetical protein DVR14_17115 [Natrinema thermotolerans]QCC61170.1 hypothetical protein DVR14_21245 [Natrinema thermotolerans]WMT07279.1 hypothetical protein NP511_18050 [Natrinema thermotolerans]